MRWRAALFTSGLVALVLAGFIWYTVAELKASLVSRAGERARTTAMLLAGQTASTTQQGSARFQALANDPALRDFLNAPTDATRARAIDRLRAYATTESDQVMELWSIDRRCLASDMHPLNSSTAFPPAQFPSVAGVNPLESYEGKLFTRIVAEIRADGTPKSPLLGYVQFVRRMRPTTSATVNGIVGGGATVLIGNQSGGVWTDLERQVPSPGNIDPTNLAPQEFSSPKGTRLIGAVAPITGTPWVTLIQLPRDEAVAPARQLADLLFVAAMAFLFVTMVVAASLSSAVVRPVAQLTDAVRTLTRGDFSSRVSVRGPDEVGRLGVAFNAMAQQIQQGRIELEARAAELTVARESADRANRVKDEFLAVLSHELRTPLSAMLGWCRMLREGMVPADKLAHAYEVIERNAVTQLRLVEDLLDVSRIVAGKFSLDVRVIDPTLVVMTAVESARPVAMAKGIGLETAVESSVARVNGDAERLQQAVGNLLANALKFTAPGGRIRVSLRSTQEGVEIAVHDNGKGLTAEELPYVFDRLQQGEAGTARRHTGLGLGLTIVREVIERHGGTVQAESAGPGQGATFRLVIPAAAGAPLALPEAPLQRDAKAAEISLRGLRILVVEDVDDARELLTEMLTRHGSLVAAVSDGEEALEWLDSHQVDVIVSDIEMPNLDGLEFLRRLRARRPDAGGTVPAIALTAYATRDDVERSLAAGFQAHLSKPLEIHELQRAIGRVVPVTAG